MSRLGSVILWIVLLGYGAESAQAQLYVAQPQSNVISKYDVKTGALINASFITGLHSPHGLTVVGNDLYVTEYGSNSVGKYNATTGAPINRYLIKDVTSPQAVAISGNDLYVTGLDGQGTGMVGKYNATTGAAINPLLVSRIPAPMGMVVDQGKLFVVYGNGYGSLGEYDADTGAVINPSLSRLPDPNGLVMANDSMWATGGVNAPSGGIVKLNKNGKNALGFNRPFIRGLNYPDTIAVSGDNVFVASPADGTVGKYSAADGSVINASFISGLKGDVTGIATVATEQSAAIALKSEEFGMKQDIFQFFLLFLLGGYYLYFAGFFVAGLLILWAVLMYRRRKSVAPIETGSSDPAEVAPASASAGPSLIKTMLIGGVVLVILLIGAFVAYEVGMSYYLAKMESLKVVARQEVEAEQKKALPPVRLAEPITVITMPATLVDPEGFKTENNWLASMIAKRIASMAYLALNPTQTSIPDIHVSAKVDADQRQVHLEITGFSTNPVATNVQPDFAWDPESYAQVASKLLGNATIDSAKPDDPLPDELTTLFKPTAANLAAEDVALSALLQKHPAWPEAHEQAALLLVTLALRDRAENFTDSRLALCRATAHLALAQALRGSTLRTWSGEIADAAVRVLAGREVDALAHLDALAARSDCPEPAKTWIAALRLRTKDDWRMTTPDANSPLLLKIAWFQVLNDNLTSLAAERKLEKIGAPEKVTDWGHAALTNRVGGAVETSNQYCNDVTTMEIADLATELAAEGASPATNQRIGEVLSGPLEEKLLIGNPPAYRIIGPDMFKDYARQHLMVELRATYYWLNYLLGIPGEARKFRVATQEQFAGMRRFESLGFFAETCSAQDINRELGKTNTTWFPWELADGKMPDNIHPDIDAVSAFYQDGMPFGTVYNIHDRMNTLWIGASHHKQPAPGDIHFNLPTYPYAQDLQKLAPSSLDTFVLDKNRQDFFQITKPWWDYNLLSLDEVKKLSNSLDEEDNNILLKKRAALNPDVWFELGDFLRKEGKDDDAATADQLGVDEGFDKVLMANSVGHLVDYYYDHNNKDKALQIAQNAAEVYSCQGLLTYTRLLEKMGNLADAEKNAQAIAERYDDRSELDRLYAAHKDFFHDQNKILMDQVFPQGMDKVTINSFTNAPAKGCLFTRDSPLLKEASLQTGDIVVGFDGTRIENMKQYDYVRALSQDPHMDLIIWRKDRYMEVHASAPKRIFDANLVDYPEAANP